MKQAMPYLPEAAASISFGSSVIEHFVFSNSTA
jgi:hypothetical protein